MDAQKKTRPRGREGKPLFLVLGGGIAGLSAAHRLSQAGLQVHLFSHPGKNCASQASQGILCIKGLSQGRSPLFTLKIKGHGQHHGYRRELAQITKSSIPASQGVYEYAPHGRAREALKRRIYGDKALEDLDTEELEGEELLKRSPFWHKLPPQSGCLYYPKDGWFHSQGLLNQLKKACLLGGVVFHKELILRIISQGKKVGLSWEKGSLLGEELILAAGQHSSQLLKTSGLQAAPEHRSQGYSLLGAKIHGPPCSLSLVRGLESMHIRENKIYVGSYDSKETLKEKVDDWLKMGSLSLAEGWERHLCWGERCQGKDRLPLWGPLPLGEHRILLNYGFHKSGYSLADLSAQALVYFLEQGEIPKDFQALHVGRFS